jgi:hypothetical protein
MPRYRRQIENGSIQHLISRFVNRQFLFDEPGARAEYLTRVARVLQRADWVPLAYALMSSHVHWVVRAGRLPSSAFVKPLHVGFARWLNRSSGRLGPVFADRHRSVTCIGDTAAATVAYVHNNPVRAGVVSDARDSSWTSHRCYVGLESAPPWLDVAQGLRLCGYPCNSRGRQRFGAFVHARVAQARSVALSAGDLERRRKRARVDAGIPVELGTPAVSLVGVSARLNARIIVPESCPARLIWRGDPREVIEVVACVTGIRSERLRSRARTHAVTGARRLALLVWGQLARPTVEMARALGASASAASGLLGRASQEEHVRAARLAAAMHGATDARGRSTGGTKT